MNDANAKHPGECDRFKSALGSGLDAASFKEGAGDSFIHAHRLSCEGCSEWLDRRILLEEALRLAGRSPIHAPTELDTRMAGFGDPETFIKLMFAKLEPVTAPRELDWRVLETDPPAQSPRRFVVLKRVASNRRMVYAAAAAVTIMIGGSIFHRVTTEKRANQPAYVIKHVELSEMPPMLRAQAAPLSGWMGK